MKRDILMKFVVSPEEQEIILDRQRQSGCTSLAAYLRRMAMAGYLIRLDLPELQEISTLLRRVGNNINQIAKRANETRRVYGTDLQEVQRAQAEILEKLGQILALLSRLE